MEKTTNKNLPAGRFCTISRLWASRAVSLLVAWALILPVTGSRAANPDEQFLAAEEAFRGRDTKALEFYVQALKDHPLVDYPQYWLLSLKLKDADPAQVKDFLKRYPEGPLPERLRTEWLRTLGRNQQWSDFAAEYPKVSPENTDLLCYSLQQRIANQDKEAIKEARPLWFVGHSQPESCEPLFAQLLGEKLIANDDVWERMRLASFAGNVGVFRAANSYLDSAEAVDEKQFDKMRRSPSTYLDKKPLALKTRAAREVAAFAVLQIARKDHGLAAVYWQSLESHYPAKDQAKIWGQIGYHAAWAQDSAALTWYKKAGDVPMTDVQLGWKARAALRAANWDEVASAIAHMSEAEQSLATWRYWKARALKAQGKSPEARELFLPLSQEFGYYGQLASEEVGEVMTAAKEPWQPNPETTKQVEDVSGIKRALYLNRVGLWQEGVKEWNFAVKSFDDQQLLTAATIANRANWYDRAIHAAEKTKSVHDMNLRFPTPFRSELTSAAKQNRLDEAWVYGIVRQESRFYADAKSRVGAMGLMQLMPATARWIAQRLGISKFNAADAGAVDTNAAFGTYYLRHVLDELGHPVMATAAYNGGPKRAARWRDIKTLEGAIYVESIPLNETRDYVKKVMANATTYAGILGLKWQSLKDRLGKIPARSSNVDDEVVAEPENP